MVGSLLLQLRTGVLVLRACFRVGIEYSLRGTCLTVLTGCTSASCPERDAVATASRCAAALLLNPLVPSGEGRVQPPAAHPQPVMLAARPPEPVPPPGTPAGHPTAAGDDRDGAARKESRDRRPARTVRSGGYPGLSSQTIADVLPSCPQQPQTPGGNRTVRNHSSRCISGGSPRILLVQVAIGD